MGRNCSLLYEGPVVVLAGYLMYSCVFADPFAETMKGSAAAGPRSSQTAPTPVMSERPRTQVRSEQGEALPPVSWTCPMHPEVVDNKSGLCPICQMKLIPLRLDLVWTCPVHWGIDASEPGTCRRCGENLVRVVKALSWTCRVHRQVDELNPGVCPVCKRRLVSKYSDRPHGDHNPKHGGQFAMAPNNWHIEGTHPAAGVFQLHVYDEYSKPFIPAEFSARLLLPPSAPHPGQNSEISVPFKRAASRRYLQARIPRLTLPAAIVIKARFRVNEPEYHFDFYFSDYSKEPSARLSGATGKAPSRKTGD